MVTFGELLEGEDQLTYRAVKLPSCYEAGITFDDGRRTGYAFVSDEDALVSGFAVVHQVQNSIEFPGEAFALKVFLIDLASDHASRERWIRERDILSKLSNCECVPSIMGIGELQGLPAIIMRWAGGTTLRECIQNNDWQPTNSPPFDIKARLHDAVAWIGIVCDAMEDVRERARQLGWDDLVHGDIKPDNIKLESVATNKKWKAWILDFGESRLELRHNASAKEIARSTPRGITWRYVSPELLEDAEASDHRSDQYQIGACLDEILEIIRTHIAAALKKDWTLWWRHLGTFLTYQNAEQVAARMTARNKRNRYRSFSQAASHLKSPWLASFTRHWNVQVPLLILSIGLVALLASWASQKSQLDHLTTEKSDLQQAKSSLAKQNEELQSALTTPAIPLNEEKANELFVRQWTTWEKTASSHDSEWLAESAEVAYSRWSNNYGRPTADEANKKLREALAFFTSGNYDLDLAFNGDLLKEYAGYPIHVTILIAGEAAADAEVTIDDSGKAIFLDIPLKWSPGQSMEIQADVDRGYWRTTTLWSENKQGPLALLKIFKFRTPLPSRPNEFSVPLYGPGNQWKCDVNLKAKQ